MFKQGQRIRCKLHQGVGFVNAVIDGRVFIQFPSDIENEFTSGFGIDLDEVYPTTPSSLIVEELEVGCRFAMWNHETMEVEKYLFTDLQLYKEYGCVDLDSGYVKFLAAHLAVDLI
jgi:hypothetical protein